MQKRTNLIAKLLVPLGIVPLIILGRIGGAPAGRTGAPGELTCFASGCHASTGGELIRNSNGIQIGFPDGATYDPGVTQRLKVTVSDNRPIFGFQLSARDPSNNQAGTLASINASTHIVTSGSGIDYITHSIPRPDGMFEFNWTPPQSDVGTIRLYVAANAANGNGSPTGDRIHLRSFVVEPAVTVPLPTIRIEQPVLQAFDNAGRLSAGTHIQIFGDNLSSTERAWAESDFVNGLAPAELDGVKVNVNNKPAFVSFISKTQVNAFTPDDPAEGPVNVEVVNDAGASNSVVVEKGKVSPALQSDFRFASNGANFAVARFPDFIRFVGPVGLVAGANFQPAKPGDTIIFFALGCGPSNPPTPSGQVPSASLPLALPFEFRIGGVVAEATGVLVAPFLGLSQFNVKVPNVDGEVAVDLSVDGVPNGQTLVTSVQNE